MDRVFNPPPRGKNSFEQHLSFQGASLTAHCNALAAEKLMSRPSGWQVVTVTAAKTVTAANPRPLSGLCPTQQTAAAAYVRNYYCHFVFVFIFCTCILYFVLFCTCIIFFVFCIVFAAGGSLPYSIAAYVRNYYCRSQEMLIVLLPQGRKSQA